MPTRNRRKFVSQAIWYFLRQDYAERELIIVDDGQDRIEDLIPADERIQYLRSDQPISLGKKLNLACEIGRGDLIAHWEMVICLVQSKNSVSPFSPEYSEIVDISILSSN
jgi:O-antigen biosynthesis protein